MAVRERKIDKKEKKEKVKSEIEKYKSKKEQKGGGERRWELKQERVTQKKVCKRKRNEERKR